MEYVAGDYFGGLGIRAAAGRLIAPERDRTGATAVPVVGFGLSEGRFGGAPPEVIVLLHTNLLC